MKLLPQPTGFLIVTNRSFHEVEQRFTFYGGNHGSYASPMGTTQGNINDPWFVRRLEYWRAKLMLAGVPYHQSVCAITNRQVKHLNDRERWERKASKTFNEFTRRAEAIRGNLFYEDKLKELCTDYRNTVAILKQRYNQE